MLVDPGTALLGYRFVAVIMTTGVPNPVDIAFQEVSGLSMSRSVQNESNMTTLSNQRSLQTLVLKRGVFSGVSPLTTGNITESVFWRTRLLRKDILVSVLNGKGNPMNAWLVSNAYMEAWDWDTLSGESSKLLIEKIKFKYSGVKYLPLTVS